MNVCGYRVCTGVRTSPNIEDESKERWTAMDAYGHIEVTFSRARNTQLPPAQRSVVVQTFHGFTTTDHDGRVCAEFEIRSRQRRRCVYTTTVVRAWFEPEWQGSKPPLALWITSDNWTHSSVSSLVNTIVSIGVPRETYSQHKLRPVTAVWRCLTFDFHTVDSRQCIASPSY